VVRDAAPPETVDVPNTVAPFLKVTSPVLPSGSAELTVAVRVTVEPKTEGFGVVVSFVMDE